MTDRDDITGAVVGAAIEVHRELGPGLLESVYEVCLSAELSARGVDRQRQVFLPVTYKGQRLDADLRIDVLLPGQLVVELKAVERLLPVHEAHLLTYPKPTKVRTGLLLELNVPVLRSGIKRMVN